MRDDASPPGDRPERRVRGTVELPGLPLAYGDLADEHAAELRSLKGAIEAIGGFSCRAYKEPCLRRRIAVRMRARGVHRYGDYEALLHDDQDEYERLLDVLTIGVSKFFRNPEVWGALEEKVLPELFALEAPEVRIWSAGCAGGEEPYTLAILLQEYAEKHSLLDRLVRFRILATDVDRGSLGAAAQAEFADFAFTEAPRGFRERWFVGTRSSRLQRVPRVSISLQPLDLTRDPYPRGQHLVVCRNVLIYFERDVQQRVLSGFYEALTPRGFLLLGKVETLIGSAAGRFRPVANRERIFRKA